MAAAPDDDRDRLREVAALLYYGSQGQGRKVAIVDVGFRDYLARPAWLADVGRSQLSLLSSLKIAAARSSAGQ